MIFGLVRTKHVAARPKIVSIFVTALISGLLVSIPVTANAVPLSAPNCVNKAGVGGLATTNGNNGCVIIKYDSSGTTYYETFNYLSAADQNWTSPAGVNLLTFYLVGAGGGGGLNGPGASAGFTTGTYVVSAPTAFTIIVGQAGSYLGNAPTYGGGGRGGGASLGYGSGGGRSAIRLATGGDLITAGGGGGGGIDNYCAGGGGGSSGAGAVARNNPDAKGCLLYTSPSPRDRTRSRMPSSA